MKQAKLLQTVLVIFLLFTVFSCSNLFEQKALGSIEITMPTTETLNKSRAALSQTKCDELGITDFRVSLIGSNINSPINKENIKPGETIEFKDVPVGECTVVCEAFALDEQYGYREFKYGGEDTRKVDAGKTTKFSIILKPAVFVSFTSPYQNIPVIRDAWEGATITMPEPSIFTHEDPDGNLRTFVPEGYEFEYWKRIDDETEKEYYVGDRFTLEDKNIKPSFIAVLKKVGPTQIGDIAYSDMTTSRFVLDGKNPIGLVIAVENGKATKIMSLKEGSYEWNTSYNQNMINSIEDENDGYSSRAFYNETDSYNQRQLEALQYANNDCTEGELEWYVPAKNELALIFENKTVLNETLNYIGKTQISSSYYWSSTYSNSSKKMITIQMLDTYSTVNQAITEFGSGSYATDRQVRCFARFAEN